MHFAAGSAVRRVRGLFVVAGLSFAVPFAHAEGSRTLFPASYPVNPALCDAADPCRADLDLTLDTAATAPYMGVAQRRQFLYVYAKAGELIELGSSNRANGGDIFVYNPQSFGTKGAETIPGTADFTCSAVSTYGGGTRGTIGSRNAELAGPNSADGTATNPNGWAPCAYVAPSTGIYGVRFTVATAGGSGPDGIIGTPHVGSATVAAWEVQVRSAANSKVDINGRLFTYAQIAFTGGNNRPVYYTVYYSTLDGQRYQQTMTGLDPNGYALWADSTGFLDNGQPLYHDIRGGGAQVSPGTGQFLAELSAPAPQMPLFFSTIDPAGPNATEVSTVLTALGIPLAPATPSVSAIAFNGLQSGNQTYVGGGGTFTFTAANDTTFQIVISRGVDFDPANPLNATLTGLAPNGNDSYTWNGLDNSGGVFPTGTFTFQITGRNGEIHFPIIDAEGNKNGGPTLTKLNGSPLNDHTVYFDDRGYKTSGGTTIGTVNGALCPAGAPDTPPTPDHSLLGVDSSANVGGVYYRNWPNFGNNNADCSGAASQGFGDAKGLDLWSFQSTPAFSSTVVINPANITLSKTGPASVKLNTPFNYTINFGNSGGGASGTSLTVSDVLPAGVIANSVAAGTGVTSVNCGALPSAAGATLTCAVTLSAPLAAGAPNGTALFTVNATATVSGTAVNNASVDPTGGNTPPPPGAGCTPAASCGTATTNVIAPPTISKAFGAATIPLNGSTSLTFTISNPNAATALSGIAVSDTLPAGLVVATPNGLTNTCGGAVTATAGSGSVSLAAGTLAAASTCTISINVTGTTAGTKNNTTGAITSTEGGPGSPSNTATVVVLAPPAIAKAFSPTSIALNGSSSLTLTITNPNAGNALAGVAVTDTFPAGLLVATPNGLVSTCGGSVTATAGSNSVTLSGGAVGAGGTCTITLNVTGTTLGTKNNTTGAVSSTNAGTGNTASASLVVLSPPSIAKAFSPTTIALNGSSSLTLTITNPNAGTALAGVAVTDTFPAGLLVATPNGLVNTCGGAVTATAGSNSVSLSAGAVAAGGSCTITLNVTGTTAGTLRNTTGTVSSTNAGTGNTATATLTVLAPPSIAKAFTPGTIPLNGSSSLTLTITNPNAGTALAGVAVTDTFPAGLLVATPNGLVNTCGGAVTATAGSNSVSLSAGAVAAGGSCTITLNVTGTTAGTLSNTTGTVSSTNAGTGNTATANLVVIAPPSIAKAFSPTSIPVNGTSTLTLTLTNPAANTVALTGVAVSDTFPANMTVATPNGLTNTCGGSVTATAGSGSATLSGGTIAAAGSCTITLNVTVNSAGGYTNTTGAVSSTNGGTGNTATAILNATAIAPPTISKAFGVATIALNGSTSLTFTIANPNAATALSGVAFTDNLPAGLVVATPNGLSNTCGGSVTATAGSGSIALSAGSLAANANCTISVNVTGTTTGTKNNTTGAITSTESGPGVPSNTATIVVLAPPSIAKAFSPTTIALNGTSSLTLTITNPNAGTALAGVAVTDAFPAGLLVATPNGLSSTCGGSVTATAGSGNVSLSGGSIAAGGSCTITLNVTGTTAGTLSNTTGTVSSTNAGTGNSATANLIVLAPPSIAKAFAPASIAVNGISTLTLTITNPNAGTALAGVAVTDTFPANLLVATPNNLSNACGGSVTATAGSGSVSLSGGTIAANGSCAITLDVTATAPGSLVNTTGNVSSTNAGSGNTATATLTASAIAPPSIAKAFGAATIALNGTTTLSFTITNPNAATALNGVAVTDNLPAGLAVATPNGLIGSCGGGTITATAGSSAVILSGATLPANGSCTFGVDVVGTAVGAQNNTTGNVTSTNGGNGNSASASVTVLAPPSVVKAFAPTSIGVNGTSTLTITLGNTNAVDLTGTAFTDTLPAGVTTQAASAATTCTPGTANQTAGTVGVSGATIPANGSCTVSVTVTASAGGTYVNTIPVGAVTTTNGGSNTTPTTATLTVTAMTPPSVVKGFSPTAIAPGGTSTLTITLSNANASALMGVSMTDTLPAGMTVASPNALASSCGGTASASVGSGSVTLTGGTIAANGTCTISVAITAAASGNFVNTIAVGAVDTSNAGPNVTPTTATLVVQAPAAIAATPALDWRGLVLLAFALLAGGGWAQARSRRR